MIYSVRTPCTALPTVWFFIMCICIGLSWLSSVSKESACSAGDPGSIPSWENPLEKEVATYSNILAWKVSWTEETGGLWSRGLQRVRHHWATNTYLSYLPGGLDDNKSTCKAGNLSLIPGSGCGSPGEGNGYPLQYPYLENPMDRGA